MTPYSLTAEDMAEIAAAREEENQWESPHIAGFKYNIKRYCLDEQGFRCCYCIRNLRGEHPINIHAEHILPKGGKHFPIYIFEPRNISVACLRCNIGKKRQKTNFIRSMDEVRERPFESHTYLFVHPILDVCEDHLRLKIKITKNQNIVKYKLLNASEKAKFAYDFFELYEFENNSYDKAQGAEEIVELSSTIPIELIEKIDSLTLLDRSS